MGAFSLTATDTGPTHKSSLLLLNIHLGYKLLQKKALSRRLFGSFQTESSMRGQFGLRQVSARGALSLPSCLPSLLLETGWGRLSSCLDNICPRSLPTCTALIYKLPGALVIPSRLIFYGFHKQSITPTSLSPNRDMGQQTWSSKTTLRFGKIRS